MVFVSSAAPLRRGPRLPQCFAKARTSISSSRPSTPREAVHSPSSTRRPGWSLRPEDGPPATTKESARIAATMLQGSLFTPPEADLNVYYVVTLNHNETLSVVDPLFGFGGSKLLALVPLAARGDDWALGPGGRQIFVAMPDANQVAVVDTQTWKVTANLPGGIRPDRLGLQPDGRLLWVAGGADGSDDFGVTVIDPSSWPGRRLRPHGPGRPRPGLQRRLPLCLRHQCRPRIGVDH